MISFIQAARINELQALLHRLWRDYLRQRNHSHGMLHAIRVFSLKNIRDKVTVIRWFFTLVLAIKILTRHIRIFWKAGWFSSLVAPLVFLWLSTVGSTWKLDRRLSCSQTLQRILFVCTRGSCFVAERIIQTSYYGNILQSVPSLLIMWNISRHWNTVQRLRERGCV